MANLFKGVLVASSGWIATMWPGPWTVFFLLVSLSLMCFGMALEKHLAKRAAATHSQQSAAAAEKPQS